jgi:hypothetical protein
VKAEARDEGQSGHSHTLRGAEARELKRHFCVGNEKNNFFSLFF